MSCFRKSPFERKLWSPSFSPVNRWVRGSEISPSFPHHRPHNLLSVPVFALVLTLSPTPIPYSCQGHLSFQTTAFVSGHSIGTDSWLRARKRSGVYVCLCMCVCARMNVWCCRHSVYTGEIWASWEPHFWFMCPSFDSRRSSSLGKGCGRKPADTPL